MTQRSKNYPARERLLSTASRLFYERGYSEVGIDEIIRESGVAKATFYNHFESKDRLVEAWLENIHQNSIHRFKQVIDEEGSATEKIVHSFDLLIEHLLEHQYRGCPYSNSCVVTDPDNRQILDVIKIHKESSRDFYYRLARLELEDDAAATQLANQIFILYSGATTEAQNLQEVWPVQVAKEMVTAICSAAFGNG